VLQGRPFTIQPFAAGRTPPSRIRQGASIDQVQALVSWLTANGPLRDGMSEEDAATIAWAVASPEVHGLLRVGRGWTQERYREWLAATLTRTLLP